MNGRFRIGNSEAPRRFKQGVWIRPGRPRMHYGETEKELAATYDGLGPEPLEAACRCGSGIGVRQMGGIFCRRCGRKLS